MAAPSRPRLATDQHRPSSISSSSSITDSSSISSITLSPPITIRQTQQLHAQTPHDPTRCPRLQPRPPIHHAHELPDSLPANDASSYPTISHQFCYYKRGHPGEEKHTEGEKREQTQGGGEEALEARAGTSRVTGRPFHFVSSIM
ncbi:hypothetical protein ACLOJK_005876 [Asimina triloba]